jgi:hypothetical protein
MASYFDPILNMPRTGGLSLRVVNNGTTGTPSWSGFNLEAIDPTGIWSVETSDDNSSWTQATTEIASVFTSDAINLNNPGVPIYFRIRAYDATETTLYATSNVATVIRQNSPVTDLLITSAIDDGSNTAFDIEFTWSNPAGYTDTYGNVTVEVDSVVVYGPTEQTLTAETLTLEGLAGAADDTAEVSIVVTGRTGPSGAGSTAATDDAVIADDASEQVATPTFGTNGGSFSSATTTTITSTTPGSTCFWREAGTEDDWTSVGGPVDVDGVAQIEAYASAGGFTDSEVATSGVFTFTGATPTFSPVAGTYGATQNVTISSATVGATIHYTTNGDTPTTGSSVYSSPVAITASGTLKALAVKTGYTDSAVGSAAYVIQDADAFAWFAAQATAGNTINSTDQATYNQAFVDLRSQANYSGLVQITPLWHGNATYNAIPMIKASGVANPTFTSLTTNAKDMQGGGTTGSHMSCNFNPSTYQTVNGTGFGMLFNTTPPAGTFSHGMSQAANTQDMTMTINRTGIHDAAYVGDFAYKSENATVKNAKGIYYFNRYSSTQARFIFYNGTVSVIGTNSSQNLSNYSMCTLPFYYFKLGSTGAGTRPSTARLSLTIQTDQQSTTQQDAIATILYALAAAFGAT